MGNKKKNWEDLICEGLNPTEYYRWPKKGDRLLRNSEDWYRGVDFSGDEMSRHVHIWSGYMSAAAALIDMCKENPHERNFLAYPILFNYRHGIELAMKWIITRYGRYSTTDTSDFERHDLWKLWQACKQTIVEIGGESESVSIVEQIIKDFHDIDSTSLAFRYSRNKNGATIDLPDGVIDLENIRDVMDGVSHFFDGADGQLSDYSSCGGL